MEMDSKITITPNQAQLKELRRRLGALIKLGSSIRVAKRIGVMCLNNIQTHLGKMSLTRHKVADRLHAKYTRFYEDAPGRTYITQLHPGEVTITVKNTPGLSRAFHDLDIRPVRAKELTIPLSRIAYGKRVRDLRAQGHKIFRPHGTDILAESTTVAEKKGRRKKAGVLGARAATKPKYKLRPLYALVKQVHIPRDPGLLPKPSVVEGWILKKMQEIYQEEMQ